MIPTLNAAKHWVKLREGLDSQDIPAWNTLIIDSSSDDGTRQLAEFAKYQVVRIPRGEFNHGATRTLACTYLPDLDFIVFMTQDAILNDPRSIERLCAPFQDARVGAVYGRQLPRPSADPIESHGRFFNYPASSQVRSFDDRKELGFRVAFFSNSFAVYRRQALEEVGGFPSDAIVSEEVTVAAKMLITGWKIAYEATAEVIHSHSLSASSEFSRYFDIGVHHGRTSWLRRLFGTTRGDGLRYIRSEWNYLRSAHILWVPYAMFRNLSKFVAYKLGTHESRLPTFICQYLSGHPSYWTAFPSGDQQRNGDGPHHTSSIDTRMRVDQPENGNSRHTRPSGREASTDGEQTATATGHALRSGPKYATKL